VHVHVVHRQPARLYGVHMPVNAASVMLEWLIATVSPLSDPRALGIEATASTDASARQLAGGKRGGEARDGEMSRHGSEVLVWLA